MSLRDLTLPLGRSQREPPVIGLEGDLIGTPQVFLGSPADFQGCMDDPHSDGTISASMSSDVSLLNLSPDTDPRSLGLRQMSVLEFPLLMYNHPPGITLDAPDALYSLTRNVSIDNIYGSSILVDWSLCGDDGQGDGT